MQQLPSLKERVNNCQYEPEHVHVTVWHVEWDVLDVVAKRQVRHVLGKSRGIQMLVPSLKHTGSKQHPGDMAWCCHSVTTMNPESRAATSWSQMQQTIFWIGAGDMA
eukprot:40601-Amphidinium_carterae.1